MSSFLQTSVIEWFFDWGTIGLHWCLWCMNIEVQKLRLVNVCCCLTRGLNTRFGCSMFDLHRLLVDQARRGGVYIYTTSSRASSNPMWRSEYLRSCLHIGCMALVTFLFCLCAFIQQGRESMCGFSLLLSAIADQFLLSIVLQYSYLPSWFEWPRRWRMLVFYQFCSPVALGAGFCLWLCWSWLTIWMVDIGMPSRQGRVGFGWGVRVASHSVYCSSFPFLFALIKP